jgi:hypothetical protein
MRNGEYDGTPWCISEFNDPEVRRGDTELLRQIGTPKGNWKPTPEMLAKSERDRAEARTWLAALDERRRLAASKNVRQIRERQEQKLNEMWREQENRLLEKRKTGS